MQLSEIFRARIVDVSEEHLTLVVTGDPGKMAAFLKALNKYMILAIARTGKISLKRGDVQQDTESCISKDQIVETSTDELVSYKNDVTLITNFPSYESYDVYVEDHNILDARYDLNTKTESHILSIAVSNSPGVLNQVTGVFARRGYSVQSLAVGPSEHDGISRITMVVPANTITVKKLLKQVQKLVVVESVTDLSLTPSVHRELMLIKVCVSSKLRSEISDLANIFQGDIVDISLTTITIALSGRGKKLAAFQDLCTQYGILEVARTGRVALIRESGVDTRSLEGFHSGNVML